MSRVLVRHSADRRRVVSTWFKRRLAARLIFFGLVVLVAVCFAHGAVGIAIGGLVLVGIAVLVQFERRRRRSLGRLSDTIPC